MFCPECGKQIKDGARFCPYCGTSIVEQKTKQEEKKSIHPNEWKEKIKSTPKNKLVGIIATILAVVILLIVVLSVLPSRSKAYEKDFAQMVKYLNEQYDGDIETLYKLNDYSRYSADADWEITELGEKYLDNEYSNTDIDGWLDIYDELSDEFGSDYKITYEVVNKQELSAKDLRDYENDAQEAINDSFSLSKLLRKEYDNDIDEMLNEWIESGNAGENTTVEGLQEYISKCDELSASFSKKYGNATCDKGYKLRVRLTIKGDYDSSTETTTFEVYRFGGTWNTVYSMGAIAGIFLDD